MKLKAYTLAGMKYFVSPWFDPYKKGLTRAGRRRTNFKEYAGSRVFGVYMVRSKKTGKVLYVGYSDYQLRKTIYRHFQEWSDPGNGYAEQYRTTFKNPHAYQIQLIFPERREDTIDLESYFILLNDPEKNKVETGPAFRNKKARKRVLPKREAEEDIPF